jgi:hypothetical protein
VKYFLQILLDIIIPILGMIFAIIQTIYLVMDRKKEVGVNENKKEKNVSSISNIYRLINRNLKK